MIQRSRDVTALCDYIVIMGGSSREIGKPFALDLLVRVLWLTPFQGTARQRWASGRSRPFVSWVTARVHKEQLLCSVRRRHPSYQKHLHWTMQSRAAGAATAQGLGLPLHPSRGGSTRLGSASWGLSLVFARLELLERSCAILLLFSCSCSNWVLFGSAQGFWRIHTSR